MITSAQSLAPPVPRRDSREIRCSLAKFIGWGYVAFFVIVVTEIPDQLSTVPMWWTPIALAGVFVPGWLMLAGSYVDRAVRLTTVVLPYCCALGYLLVAGSWFLVWTEQHTTSSTGTWLVTFPGLAALTLVVAPWRWLAVPYLVLALCAVQVANSWARSQQYGQLLVTDIAWGIAFSALFVLAGLMAVRTGDELDATYASTLRLTADAVAQREREAQRKLYGHMIHDSILAVMGEAPRANEDPSVGRDAREALRDWAGQEEAGSSKQPIGLDEVVDRIRKSVIRAFPAVDIAVEVDPDAEQLSVVPMRVGAALADAAGEAVRNARRHGGPGVSVAVTVRLDSSPLRVTVVDDGPGFDPSTTVTGRLGLQHSIIERMSDVGGHARIDSTPGVGTRIELLWPR
ncbi:ATP-binding protein [Mycobacterium hackensackense]|uniref:sensor histidine kinase n=1 Tax=Mycobacterium hackensackense TaxID=228909 RepID=UPI0022659487|nr:ATP-binding protein [Mycobacterium hackensackense]MCV7256890.1 ATP-binding protein [Mycobacterium hackensackense]